VLREAIHTASNAEEWREKRHINKYGPIDQAKANRALIGACFQLALIRTTWRAIEKLLRDYDVAVVVPLNPGAHRRNSGLPRDDLDR
jgi:hypothetical protein